NDRSDSVSSKASEKIPEKKAVQTNSQATEAKTETPPELPEVGNEPWSAVAASDNARTASTKPQHQDSQVATESGTTDASSPAAPTASNDNDKTVSDKSETGSPDTQKPKKT